MFVTSAFCPACSGLRISAESTICPACAGSGRTTPAQPTETLTDLRAEVARWKKMPTLSAANHIRLAEVYAALVRLEPYPGDQRVAAVGAVKAWLDAGCPETARDAYGRHYHLFSVTDRLDLLRGMARVEAPVARLRSAS